MGVFHSTGMDPPVISLREQSGDRPGTGMKRHRCAVLSSVSTQLSIHSAHLGCSRCDSLAPTVAPTAWAADRQIGQGSSAAMKEEKKTSNTGLIGRSKAVWRFREMGTKVTEEPVKQNTDRALPARD